MARLRGLRAWIGTAAALALLAGCGWGGDEVPAAATWSGPDDTSNLWTALGWSIEVDYPFYATVADLAAEADLVVRGRVVDVAAGRFIPSSDHAEVTIEVTRVLGDPEGRQPTRIVVSIPVNSSNDLERVDAEAPKPQDVIVAVARMGAVDASPGSEDEQKNVGGPTVDQSPPLFGLVSNDSVIDVAGGFSYTPFNDNGSTPAPDDPFRGHTLDDIEAAFLAAG